MRATVMHGAGDVCIETVPDSTLIESTDAVVRVTRAYIDELLPDILEGRIEPGRVLDRVIGLDEVPDDYRAMANRRSIKVMVTP
jgi:threonine dehydrogenase-like Zn-dependent dehydrogenase